MFIIISSSFILFIICAIILSDGDDNIININLFTYNQKLIINIIISSLVINYTKIVIFYNIFILFIQLCIFIYYKQNNNYKLFMYFCGITSLILFLSINKINIMDKIMIYLFSQVSLFV
jgi:hypothetical protein